jgi:hypothetical protein
MAISQTAVVVDIKDEKTRRQIEADYEATIKAFAKTLEFKTATLQLEFARNCENAVHVRDTHLSWIYDEGQG